MKTSTKTLIALMLIVAIHLPGQSVPNYVNYQGLLKASDGSPLATGNYTIEFNIYDQANAGTRVWGPFIFDGSPGNGHGALVPVVNGTFNVIIGPRDSSGVSIADAFSGPNRFIEIKVNGGDPILPRQQFLSTAYAMQSQDAQFTPLAQMAVQASNLVQQAADALCPPGSIIAFGGSAVPEGWLLCDGRPLTNAMFQRLYAVIGTSWGNGTLDSNGVAENPPNLETGFNLPDLRGVFLRGVNGSLAHTNWWDPDYASRTNRYGGNSGNHVGSVQNDELRSHNHANGDWKYLVRISGANTIVSADNSPTEGDVKVMGLILPAGGAETRPKNAYVNYIIKY